MSQSPGRAVSGRNLSLEVKRLQEEYFLAELMYGSETWIWNRIQQSRVGAVEMRYLIGTYEGTRWDGGSNDSMYGRYGMGPRANEANCGVVE